MRVGGRLTPEQFWARMTAMEDEVRAQVHVLPLYGLANWPGPLMLGEWGSVDGTLTNAGLLHGEPDGDARVTVLVDTRSPEEPVLERRMSATSATLDMAAAEAALARAESPPTGTVTIPVNGVPEVFDQWIDGATWYAARQHGGHALVIEARHVDPAAVTVVTVSDIEPYLAGRRAWLRRRRGEK